MSKELFVDAESKAIIEAVTKKVQITDVLLAAIVYSGNRECVLSLMENCKDMPEVTAAIEVLKSFKADQQ